MAGYQRVDSPFDNATFWQWLVKFRSVEEVATLHPTNLCSDLDFYLGGLVTLIHALKTGGQYPFLWLSIFLHGFVVEIVTYVVPDINNFWHAQTPIMFWGGRLPLAIMFLYPTFDYIAAVAIAHLKLPSHVRPLVVGMFAALIDIPYDIMGIRLLWWTWHDTDPNIYDRFYWVPLTSFYFHTTFAASLMFNFNFLRKRIVGKDSGDEQSGCVFKELLVCCITALLGMPGGILLFAPLYHPFHDLLNVGTNVIVSILMLFIILMLWSHDRKPPPGSRPSKKGIAKSPLSHMLYIYLMFHYFLYFLLALFAQPQDVVSVGLFEPTGPCNATTEVHTPIGKVLHKRSYLCVDDYDEPFDWHCLPGQNPPPNGLSWYTICGTPFTDRAEYVLLIGAIGVFALFAYYQMFYHSATQLFNKPLSTKEKKVK